MNNSVANGGENENVFSHYELYSFTESHKMSTQLHQ